MDYEEKYNAALERAKKLQETCDSTAVVGWCEYIFPELKESEGERIVKCLLNYFNHVRYNGLDLKGTDVDEVIAWLEKQGEQKPYGQRKKCSNCQFNYAGECKGFCQMKRDEQEPADNVEPKFKVGDWVVYDHRPYQVVELPKEGYINLGLKRNGKVEFAPSTYCRHWTIQDAKDGDVLCYHVSATNFFQIAIFKRVASKDELWGQTYRNYVQYGGFGGIENYTLQVALGDNELHHCGATACPATKEQRDLLFAKMKEAGYEWDGEKKELKKIEPKKLDPDKVIEWLNDQACQGWIEDVEVDKFVDKFKEDFGL